MKDVLLLLSAGFSFVFGIWPFVLLGVVTSKRGKGSSSLLRAALNTWFLLVMMRIVMLIVSVPVMGFIIEDPANSFWFVLVGITLLILQRFDRRTADENL